MVSAGTAYKSANYGAPAMFAIVAAAMAIVIADIAVFAPAPRAENWTRSRRRGEMGGAASYIGGARPAEHSRYNHGVGEMTDKSWEGWAARLCITWRGGNGERWRWSDSTFPNNMGLSHRRKRFAGMPSGANERDGQTEQCEVPLNAVRLPISPETPISRRWQA